METYKSLILNQLKKNGALKWSKVFFFFLAQYGHSENGLKKMGLHFFVFLFFALCLG